MNIRLLWIFLSGALFLGVSFLLIPTDSEYVRLSIDAGDYDFASKRLTPVLGRPDPPVWALRDAAKVASLQGYPVRATHYLETLLRKSPGQYQDRLELARLYLDLYQPQKAALELHSLLQTEQLPVKDMIKLARSYDIMNLPSSALTILHRLAANNPGDMNYWKAILVYDSQTQNDDDMSRTLRTLTRHFPKRLDYLELRMNLAYRRGRYKEVVRMMDRIKALNGGLDRVLMPSIRSLFRLKRPIDAYLLYRKASLDIAKDDLLETVAWYFYKKKYEGFALSVFEDLIRREPRRKEFWQDAIWLSDKMKWSNRTRVLMESRQAVLPLPLGVYHARILDLDLRYHDPGRAERDLLTWIGAPGGPDLADLRLAWQTAEAANNLPLAIAWLRQALNLNPNHGDIRENLVRNYNDANQPDNAGALLLAQGYLKKDRALVRQAIGFFQDSDKPEVLKGLYFYLANSDSKDRFRSDQYALFTLFNDSAKRTGVTHLVATLQRFPDLSASMDLELARILIWRKKYVEANAVIDKVVAAYPGNRAILFQASAWFVDADQVILALPFDRKLVETDPRDAYALALWIRHRIWAGQDRQVLAYYQRLLALDPDNHTALVYMGNHAYFHGKFRQAIGYYRKAVHSGVLDYRVLYRLGQSFRQEGNERMARKMFLLAWKTLVASGLPPPAPSAGVPLAKKIDLSLPDPSGSSRGSPSTPFSAVREERRSKILAAIKIQSALGHTRAAYRDTLLFLREFPGDRSGLYWAANLLRKLGQPGRSLGYLDLWLGGHPGDKDFLLFRAELLMRTGRIHAAQRILWALHRKYAKDKVIWDDLVDSYRREGALTDSSSFDSHVFSQGETQAPHVSSGILALYGLDSWSLHNQDLGVFYPGGAAWSFDTKIETPLAKNANYFAGRTEYLGSGSGIGWGTNDYTYAGVRWTPGPGWELSGEAGDTRLTGTPGLYSHLSGSEGSLSVDLQGFDNMIWGDFGQSIVLDGLQTGYMAEVSWNALSRLSLIAESWMFDYTLENGTLPYGTLHNTVGMADLLLDTRPHLDMLVGYEDWSLLSPSPGVALLVPMLARQEILFTALIFQTKVRNRFRLLSQIGGYEDLYSHTPAYEGGAGLSYRFSTRLEGFASGNYFNQSILYNGASLEAVWGFNLWF